jgi:hypothetical protein
LQPVGRAGNCRAPTFIKPTIVAGSERVKFGKDSSLTHRISQDLLNK